jgi:hypothetical protein
METESEALDYVTKQICRVGFSVAYGDFMRGFKNVFSEFLRIFFEVS